MRRAGTRVEKVHISHEINGIEAQPLRLDSTTQGKEARKSTPFRMGMPLD
jgi:hypothetical protein